jgi:hypothetical protein
MRAAVGIPVLAYLAVSTALAAQYRGRVTFNGLPIPGAEVTASQGKTQFTAVTNADGIYAFPQVAAGVWTLTIEMTGFAPIRKQIAAGPNVPEGEDVLKLLPLGEIQAQAQKPAPTAVRAALETPRAAAPKPQLAEQDAAGLLINGSENNSALSPFGQAATFGNSRPGAKGLYNGGIGMILDNSALDAAPFSITGQQTPKPTYNDITGILTFGGPIRIPNVVRDGPQFFGGYEWTRNSTATTASALMPDMAERSGIFSAPVTDPETGKSFSENVVPPSRFSPQVQALLDWYPLPNFNQSARYNYEVPILNKTHEDRLQTRLAKMITNTNLLDGGVYFESLREASPNVFGFLDTTDILGINASANWWHRIDPNWFVNFGYQFSRMATRVTPFFSNRENVSGEAGISGNDQAPVDWGPPSLTFSSGISGLTDGLPSFDRNQTGSVSYSMQWNRGNHNISLGGDFRRQQLNYRSQQDPRGTFSFTGAKTGDDFADFLLGIPDTSEIAFGNADKYFRESVYDEYINDDWKAKPGLTVNMGLRWEYGAPITELYGRLVNLEVSGDFAAAAPVIGSDPTGSLTGERYPSSLIRPYKGALEPRIGAAWRAVSGDSLVIRAGYGIYYDTSVYQTIALQMAQQPPLSRSFSVQDSKADPLTLADGFQPSRATTENTFGVDPNFRPGYAQEWQLSLQRDLPGALQITANYLGTKGTHGAQEFLPNTVPIGAAKLCAACPVGFAYEASGGNSTREAGQIELRRRLRSGIAMMLTYTFSKSIDDDAALGGGSGVVSQQMLTLAGASGAGQYPSGERQAAESTLSQPQAIIAQNWLDLAAERSLSTFDQRHLVTLQAQYTTGMGLGGGTLLSGWKGTLFKDWTFATQISAGTGMPLDPEFFAAVPGTGFTGTIRPQYTGAPVYAAPAGAFLNPDAYAAPPPGEWGNAGRNSITGPAQLALNASLGRTFRLHDRLHLDMRFDSANALNHVTYTSWNTIINNLQFGLPTAANAMRSVQTTLRLRF